MRFPNHISKSTRKEVGRIWGQRSGVARQKLRDIRGVDAETMRRRALHDARGVVVREGRTYRSSGIVHWQVRRAVVGRTDQFEFVANGRVKLLAGPRRFPRWARPKAKQAKRERLGVDAETLRWRAMQDAQRMR